MIVRQSSGPEAVDDQAQAEQAAALDMVADPKVGLDPPSRDGPAEPDDVEVGPRGVGRPPFVEGEPGLPEQELGQRPEAGPHPESGRVIALLEIDRDHALAP